jgi:hypothetical protein
VLAVASTSTTRCNALTIQPITFFALSDEAKGPMPPGYFAAANKDPVNTRGP